MFKSKVSLIRQIKNKNMHEQMLKKSLLFIFSNDHALELCS